MGIQVKVSICNRRTDKKYKNQEVEWDYIKQRNRTPIRTSETAEEYPKLSKNQRGDIKDIGGFVGGWLKGGIRKNGNVIGRQIGLLDADHVPQDIDLCDTVRSVYGNVTYFIYSTHSHTAENPRCRIVFLFNREVTEEEYPATMRMAAKAIGMDYMDDSTYQANRMMYWASCPSNGEFIFEENDGEPLDVDALLQKYEDWRDVSQWPTSSRQSEVIKAAAKQQQNPLEKEGMVGLFCRAYGTVQNAISEYLSDVYAPTVDCSGRYDYIPGEGTAGVVIYDDLFVYSHHATDPACEKLLNAFDLVRIHKFGDEDGKKSFSSMLVLASKDERVKALSLKEKQEKAKLEFDDWTKGLEHDKSGTILNTLHNILLIMENDENLQPIVFNQLADGMEIKGEVPWQHPARFWRDADDAQLICYVDENYGTFSARNYQIAVTKVTDDRSYHPIREYLNTLPDWDHIPRIDTSLIDYLGAEDNGYVRAVSRKSFCAAVRRVKEPGIKFDTMAVLNGPQGIGKSTFIAKIGMSWYSDSLNLSDMNDKTAAEKLQGYWILEIGELAGMKKADVDKVKAFVSRQDDKYRASFGRRVTPHPRQCIFFGTTNSENGYLRDITGNRRFWNVKTPGTGKKKPWELTQEDVDQMWAEVLWYVGQGEKLYLDAELEVMASSEQKAAMEQDDREGIVREYLDTLLPESWESMDIYKRQEFIRDRDNPTQPKGVVRKDSVCNLEIWCECFGKHKEDIKHSDSYAIASIMARIEEWEKSGKFKSHPLYGRQRVYTRK